MTLMLFHLPATLLTNTFPSHCQGESIPVVTRWDPVKYHGNLQSFTGKHHEPLLRLDWEGVANKRNKRHIEIKRNKNNRKNIHRKRQDGTVRPHV